MRVIFHCQNRQRVLRTKKVWCRLVKHPLFPPLETQAGFRRRPLADGVRDCRSVNIVSCCQGQEKVVGEKERGALWLPLHCLLVEGGCQGALISAEVFATIVVEHCAPAG